MLMRFQYIVKKLLATYSPKKQENRYLKSTALAEQPPLR